MPDGEHRSHSLSHLVPYLAAAEDFDRLHSLLLAGPEWMEKKSAALRGDISYLAEVELALQRFEDPLPSSAVPIAAQLFTARHLVRCRVETYATEDLVLLAWLGREEEALNQARLRADLEERCGGLLGIHRVFRSRGAPDRKLLDEILRWASEIPVPRDQSYALSMLASELAFSGDPEAAALIFRKAEEAILRMGRTLLDRLWALQVLAGAQARAGRFPQALVAVREIRDDFYLAWTLTEVAPFAPEPATRVRMLAHAESLIPVLDYEPRRARIWRQLAGAWFSLGLLHDVDRAVGELRRLAETSGEEVVWKELVVALAQTARLEEADIPLRELEPGAPRWEALAALAEALAKAGIGERAETVAATIGDPGSCRSALLKLAALSAETGDLDRARRLFECAGAIRPGPAMQHGEREDIVSHILQLAGRSQSPVLQARETGPPADPPEVLAGHADDPTVKALAESKAAKALVLLLAERGDLEAARRAAEALSTAQERWLALATAAASLAASGRTGEAQRLIHPLEQELRPTTTFTQLHAWEQIALVHAWSGHVERALAILREVRSLVHFDNMDNLTRKFEARDLSRTMASCQAFCMAFSTLDAVPAEEFLDHVASWGPAAEALLPGLSLVMMQEVLRILSWREPSCATALERLRSAIAAEPEITVPGTARATASSPLSCWPP